jgi:hypothetical protein
MWDRDLVPRRVPPLELGAGETVSMQSVPARNLSIPLLKKSFNLFLPTVDFRFSVSGFTRIYRVVALESRINGTR